MILLLVLLSLVRFGLGPAGVEPFPPRPDPVPVPAPLVLRVDLPDLVPEGMRVPFRIALANTGPDAVRIDLGGDPIVFDLLVRGPDGETVWRRLEGQSTPPEAVSRTLSAGEVLSFEDVWDQTGRDGQPVEAGIYAVMAILPVAGVDGGWGSTYRPLTIIP